MKFYWNFYIFLESTVCSFLLCLCDEQSSELCVYFDRFTWSFHCLYSLYTLSAVSLSVIQYQHSVRGSVQLNPNTRTISSPAAALEQTSSPEHVQRETEKERRISCSGMKTLLTPTWLPRCEEGRVREKEWSEGWE